MSMDYVKQFQNNDIYVTANWNLILKNNVLSIIMYKFSTFTINQFQIKHISKLKIKTYFKAQKWIINLKKNIIK